MTTLFPPQPERNYPLHNGRPAPGIRIARAQLTTDWVACGVAGAYVYAWWEAAADEAGDLAADNLPEIVCRDPAGMIGWFLGADKNGDGDWYIPAGWYVTVWQPEDSYDGHWEPLCAGQPCPSGSGSSGSGSGSGGSGSAGGCVTAADRRLGDLPNHDPTHVQALIHDENDCLRWMDIEQCP